MGIEGLLQALKSVRIKKHIREFAGLKAAVDASTWLYKGTYSCAFDLAQGNKTNAYLRYSLKMIRLLRSNNIEPILVFDGILLPLKVNTIEQRKADKIKHKAAGDKLRDEGKREEANSMYARSISIKKSMVFTLIDILDAINVRYIVAPYEADAEIAYLCAKGVTNFAITEDSDLLAYGCQDIIYKLDYEGNCEHLPLKSLKEGTYEALIEDEFVSSMLDMDDDKFVELCIVAGCDYLPNIPGFGIKRAMKMMSRLSLDETLSRIRYQKTYIGKIPYGYTDKVRKIKYQFMSGRVIDIDTYTMTTLRPISVGAKAEDIEGLGEEFKKEIVEKYGKGLYNYKKQQDRVKMAKEEALELLKEVTAKKVIKASEEVISAETEKPIVKPIEEEKVEESKADEVKVEEEKEVDKPKEKLKENEEETLSGKKREYSELEDDDVKELEPPVKTKKL